MGYDLSWGLNMGAGLSSRLSLGLRGARTASVHTVHGPDQLEPELEDEAMKFEARELPVPATATTRAADGQLVLFVRFSAVDRDAFAYLEDPSGVRAALARARQSGHPVDRVVLVGADALFDPRRDGTPGREEALAAFAGLIRTLAAERVPFIWRTRGGIGLTLPGQVSEALLDTGRLASVEIGLPALDDAMCRALEGGRGATPEERLRLASALSARGIPVRALLDPLVPMLTDQAAALTPLLRALADAGVHRVSVRYLVLTRARAKALSRRLSRMTRDLIRGVFADEPWRSADPDAASSSQHEPHKLLPPRLRRLGHHRVHEIAAGLGLAVDILDPATESEVLTRAERVERREEAKPRAKARARKGRPQLDLFQRKTG